MLATVQLPLAAVLPRTPVMVTWSPLAKPCPLLVMTIGPALLASVIGAASVSLIVTVVVFGVGFDCDDPCVMNSVLRMSVLATLSLSIGELGSMRSTRTCWLAVVSGM